MHKSLCLVMCSVGLSIVLSCSSNVATPPTVHSLIPFAVGNHWTYVDSSFDTTGHFTSFALTQLSIDSQLQISYDGKSYRVWKWHFSNSSLASLFSDDSAGGVWSFGPVDSLDNMCLPAMFLNFKYPASTGDKWSIDIVHSYQTGRVLDSCSIDSITTKTCISSNAQYVSQAGTFQCLEYQTVTGYPTYSVTNNSFYSPGIGLVGGVGIRNGTTIVTRRVLQSYSLH